jgi:hypothetical protein
MRETQGDLSTGYFFMVKNELVRRQILAKLQASRPEHVTDLTIRLWQSIASELIPIIGEDGFAALYSRSLHVTRSTFPWLNATGQKPQQADLQFIALKASLEARTSAESVEVGAALLFTFTDILASLIGESLTTGILRAAWGDHASETTSKEFPS